MFIIRFWIIFWNTSFIEIIFNNSCHRGELMFYLLIIIISLIPSLLGGLVIYFTIRKYGYLENYISSFLIVFTSFLITAFILKFIGIAYIYEKLYFSSNKFSFLAMLLIFVIYQPILTATAKLIWKKIGKNHL